MPEDSMVQPSLSQHAPVQRYLDELYRWNRRINLTTVPHEDAATRHVGETAALLAAASPPPHARVVDVGAGGGVPGVLLAIARPDIDVALVEADSRKAAFLRHIAGLLGLDRVQVVQQRAEAAGHDPLHRERYQLAVSRAAAAPPLLCELALPLVRVGGRLVALVGDADQAAAACAEIASAWGGGAPRALGDQILEVPKLRPSPASLPRGPAGRRRVAR